MNRIYFVLITFISIITIIFVCIFLGKSEIQRNIFEKNNSKSEIPDTPPIYKEIKNDQFITFSILNKNSISKILSIQINKVEYKTENNSFQVPLTVFKNTNVIEVAIDEHTYTFNLNKLNFNNFQHFIIYCPAYVESDIFIENIPNSISASFNIKTKAVTQDIERSIKGKLLLPMPEILQYTRNLNSESNYSIAMRSGIVEIQANCNKGELTPRTITKEIKSNTTFTFYYSETSDATISAYSSLNSNIPESILIQNQNNSKLYKAHHTNANNNNAYTFHNIPIGEYEIISEENLLFLPFYGDKDTQYINGRFVLNVKENSNNFNFYIEHLSPVILTLDNDFQKANISINLDSTYTQKVYEITKGQKIQLNPSKYAFDLYFENQTLNPNNVIHMIPGNYDCVLISAIDQNGLSTISESNPLERPKIVLTIPNAQTLSTVPIKFEEYGNLLVEFDSDYYFGYTIYLQKEDANGNFQYVARNPKVESYNIPIRKLEPGNYQLSLSSNGAKPFLTDAYTVISDATTTIKITNDHFYYNRIKFDLIDTNNLPIKNINAILSFKNHNYFSKSNEKGEIEYVVYDGIDSNFTASILLKPINGIFSRSYAYKEITKKDSTLKFDKLTRFKIAIKPVESINTFPVHLRLSHISQENDTFLSDTTLITFDRSGVTDINAFPVGTFRVTSNTIANFDFFDEISKDESKIYNIETIEPFIFRFHDNTFTPIEDVELFQINAKNVYILPDGINQISQKDKFFTKTSNKDGIIKLSTYDHFSDNTFYYFHKNFGFGYVQIKEKQYSYDIILNKPARLTFDLSANDKFVYFSTQRDNSIFCIPIPENGLFLQDNKYYIYTSPSFIYTFDRKMRDYFSEYLFPSGAIVEYKSENSTINEREKILR